MKISLPRSAVGWAFSRFRGGCPGTGFLFVLFPVKTIKFFVSFPQF
jgi:hypothetical protein